MKNLLKCLGIAMFVWALVMPAKASFNEAVEQKINHNPQFEADEFVLTAESGRIHGVMLFIKDEIDVNVYSSKGRTALMAASERGHLEIVKLLLRKGADLRKKNLQNGRTALMEASVSGHASVVQELLSSKFGIAVINEKSNTGTTALSMASGGGRLDVVKKLLRAGARPELPDKNGMTSLMKACANDHADVVKELVNFYANRKEWSHQEKLIYARNKDGKLAQELTHSQRIQKILSEARNELYRQTHNN